MMCNIPLISETTAILGNLYFKISQHLFSIPQARHGLHKARADRKSTENKIIINAPLQYDN